MKIIAISGSLRKASTNTTLLREAVQLSPQGMSIELYPINEIPLYNDDLVVNGVKPKPVLKAYQHFAEADGFLFGAPCYNHSVSSPLKNVIDWISRDSSPLRGKPFGYFHSGKNPHNYIQPALQVTLEWLNMKLYNDKKVFLLISSNFDEQGNLINEKSKQNISEYLLGFKQFVEKHKKSFI